MAVKYNHPYQIKERMIVTDAEIAFMLKVYNREENLHKMNLSMKWEGDCSCDLPALKAEFHTKEVIPVNRFANLFVSQSLFNTETWSCIKSGDGIWPEQIVLFVESRYQEATRLAHWEGQCLIPTTKEYILSLEGEERLDWLEFMQESSGLKLKEKLFPNIDKGSWDSYNVQEWEEFKEILGDLRDLIIA